MARPRSEDKRNAIITSAIDLFAEQGISAPTAAIAKLAGIAEGTLFKYFATKDELVNEVYLNIKSEMQSVMLDGDSKKESPRARTQKFWRRYVEWGVAHPEKRQAMNHLTMSDRLTDDSKASGNMPFTDFNSMLKKSSAVGVMRGQPDAFVMAILRTLAETTMDFMTQHPKDASVYRDSGFEAFWKAVAK